MSTVEQRQRAIDTARANGQTHLAEFLNTPDPAIKPDVDAFLAEHPGAPGPELYDYESALRDGAIKPSGEKGLNFLPEKYYRRTRAAPAEVGTALMPQSRMLSGLASLTRMSRMSYDLNSKAYQFESPMMRAVTTGLRDLTNSFWQSTGVPEAVSVIQAQPEMQGSERVQQLLDHLQQSPLPERVNALKIDDAETLAAAGEFLFSEIIELGTPMFALKDMARSLSPTTVNGSRMQKVVQHATRLLEDGVQPNVLMAELLYAINPDNPAPMEAIPEVMADTLEMLGIEGGMVEALRDGDSETARMAGNLVEGYIFGGALVGLAAGGKRVASGVYDHVTSKLREVQRDFANLQRALPLSMTGWHGTPHTFSRFDTSNIGGGTGYQTEGWGVYIGSARETAEFYMQDGVQWNFGEIAAAGDELWSWMMDPDVRAANFADMDDDEITDYANDAVHAFFNRDMRLMMGKDEAAEYEMAWSILEKEGFTFKPGNLYKVDIPDEVIDSMMVWDKPIKDQVEVVRKLLSITEDPELKKIIEKNTHEYSSKLGRDLYRDIEQYFSDRANRPESLRELYGSDEVTSKFFYAAGIKGNRYDGAYSENYVLFNPEQDALILERNGEPVEPPRPRDVEEAMNRYLTDEERAELDALGNYHGTNARNKMAMMLENGATVDEVVAMAAAGNAKRGWYRASADAITHIFGEDAPRFTALLSALSPQTSVDSNLRNALNVWKNWVASGRQTDEASILRIMGQSVEGTKGEASVLDAWRKNTIRALTAEDPSAIRLSGPKVQSFMLNLQKYFNEVTQDTWMGRALGRPQSTDLSGRKTKATNDELGDVGIKGPGYYAANILVRQAAEVLSAATGERWTPAEVQETVWSWAKAIYENRTKDSDAVTTLMQGRVTDDTIRDVPDFATLFQDNVEFRSLLEEAGYGERIAGLPENDFGSREAIAEGVAEPGALRAAAERIDRSAEGAFGESTPRRKGKVDLKYYNAETLRQRYAALRRPGPGATQAGNARPFGRRLQRTGIPAVNDGEVVARYNLPRKQQKEFQKFGVATPPLYEVSSPAEFAQLVDQARNTSKFGGAVHVYTPEEYAEMRTFVTRDGQAGFAIKPDGDIVSVFNTVGGSHRGVARHMLALAIQEGGTKLDAFEVIVPGKGGRGMLPKLYASMGFREVRRDSWDDQYMPPGWDKDVLGEPDVVYMELEQ